MNLLIMTTFPCDGRSLAGASAILLGGGIGDPTEEGAVVTAGACGVGSFCCPGDPGSAGFPRFDPSVVMGISGPRGRTDHTGDQAVTSEVPNMASSKASARRYREKHRAQIREYGRQFYWTHRERELARFKRYRRTEKYRRYIQKYVARHKRRIRLRQKLWTQRKLREVRGKIIARLGGVCCKCHRIRPRMAIHHMDKMGKIHRRLMGSPLRYYRSIEKLPVAILRRRFALVCPKCHKAIERE